MYNCILFDMDGTLVNSYEGIYHAYRVTMEKLGRPFGGKPLSAGQSAHRCPGYSSISAAWRRTTFPRR